MADFHFTEDYRELVRQMIADNDMDTAMSLAVGGNWEQFGVKLSEFVQSQGLAPGMDVLDFGCGSGRLAYALSRDIDLHLYVGIDVVDEFLQYAAQKCPNNYMFIMNNSLTIPIRGMGFDYAFAFSVFTHLLQTEIMLYSMNIFNLLKPGGKFIFSFLEMNKHWNHFESSYIEHEKHSKPYPHLNMFLDRNQITLISDKCGFVLDKFIEPEDGIGQSVVILSKPH